MNVVTALKIAIVSTALLTPLAYSATPYQKPGAPIRVASPAQVQVDPFSKQTVTVSFESPSQGELFIAAKPKPGITIVESNPEWHFDLGEQTPEITFTIDAQESGQYYIMFHARIVENSLSSSRVFGIPVLIGDPSSQPAMLKQKAAKEFVIMQAEEKITR